MLYGNFYEGFSYSPDRSRDVDRFNPSTRANYSTTYNPDGYYSINNPKTATTSAGWYDGAGRYHRG